jgi:hypothetical protein
MARDRDFKIVSAWQVINANTYPTGVGASFAGDATYLASTATNTLTVKQGGCGDCRHDGV